MKILILLKIDRNVFPRRYHLLAVVKSRALSFLSQIFVLCRYIQPLYVIGRYGYFHISMEAFFLLQTIRDNSIEFKERFGTKTQKRRGEFLGEWEISKNLNALWFKIKEFDLTFKTPGIDVKCFNYSSFNNDLSIIKLQSNQFWFSTMYYTNYTKTLSEWPTICTDMVSRAYILTSTVSKLIQSRRKIIISSHLAAICHHRLGTHWTTRSSAYHMRAHRKSFPTQIVGQFTCRLHTQRITPGRVQREKRNRSSYPRKSNARICNDCVRLGETVRQSILCGPWTWLFGAQGHMLRFVGHEWSRQNDNVSHYDPTVGHDGRRDFL